MTGTETAEEAARVFRNLGSDHVIIKCGSEGCYCSDKHFSGWISAIPVRPVDTTGAGDDDKITDCAFSVHMTEWDPGCTIDVHSHDTQTEAMYCISGTGVAMVDGVEYPFVPDSMIVAPPKVMHQITNTGTENLKVLCIFSSPNTAKGLRDRAMATVEEALKATEK